MKTKNSVSPLISIVVLSWNGLEDTRECLKSLRKLEYPHLEIIIVDNGSTDGSKDFLAKQKDIVYLDFDQNYGFTGGHIRGLEAAHGDYVAIFNNDMVVDKQWINEALKTLKAHKKAAVVGGRSYKWNENNPIFNTDNEFMTWQEINPYTGHTRTLLVGEEECRVDAISGSALLFDVSVLKKIGYFDDDFFTYYEETDLMARMMRAGYEVYYNPNAKAWHKVAAASGGEESYFYLYMMHRNRYMFAVKNLDDTYLRPFMRNYSREFMRALVGRIVKPNRDNKARVSAYLWNMRNKRKTLAKRKEVLKLGKTYVQHLGAHQPTDVTVVIPCYNYGRYLPQAIESVLKQTLKPKKIVVIDDGSTDNTADVLKKYAKNDLIDISHKKNTGVIDTKNIGLKKSKTYWTVFFDADDVFDPEYLEKTVSAALKTKCDVVYTDMELFGPNTHAVFMANSFSIPRLIRKNFIHNSALINTTMLKWVGGYNPVMKGGLEDWDLYLSLAERGAHFAYIPEPIFKYRQHESSLSRNGAVVEKEKELYGLLLSLHPGLVKYASRPRRWAITLIKGVANLVIHPSLLVVLIKSLPRAGMRFVESLVHDLRTHKVKISER